MNARLSCTAGLLFALLVAAPGAHARLAYEPETPTLERLDDLIERSSPLPHWWNDSLIWFSAPGRRPLGLFADGFESGDVSALDANGNGSRDLFFFQEDAQGAIERMVVFDMLVNDTLFVLDLAGWEVGAFRGFYDFLGEGAKAAVFGGDGVLLFTPDEPDHPAVDLDASFQYIGVSDINDDGKMDLAVWNRPARRVEVYTFYEGG